MADYKESTKCTFQTLLTFLTQSDSFSKTSSYGFSSSTAQSRSPRIMLLVETLRVPYSNICYCCSWIPMASATSDCVSPRSFLRFFRIIASRPIFLAIAINLLLNVFVPDIIPAPECKVYSPDRTRYYCTPCALYSKTIKEILWRLGLI